MKYPILYAFTLILIGAACKSTETRPAIPSETQTIRDWIEAESSRAENYNWIDESEYDNIWIFADDFPSMGNGMREFQQRFSRTVNQNPSEDCTALKRERVFYNLVIDENGYISKIKNFLDEPNKCVDLVEITIRATELPPGK